MKTMLLAVLVGLSAGCHTVGYDRTDSTGETVKFRSKSIWTNKQIKDVDYSATRNGSRKFKLKGYSNDQTEIMESAIEAALRAYEKQRSAITP